MNSKIVTESFGKWILTGEHAVLRGAPALVFPLRSKTMRLEYTPSSSDLAFEGAGEHGNNLELLFWGVLEAATRSMGHKRQELTGTVRIKNEIPLGRGLGASAALCVVVGKWLAEMNWVSRPDLYEFCRQLENLFHGESSGVDIAVCLEQKPLHFERTGSKRAIHTVWSPIWFLSDSKKIGVTSECVRQVKDLLETDSQLGERLDQQMAQASKIAEEALGKVNGLSLLTEAIQAAGACFEGWGLTQGALQEHMQLLRDAGAVAVKPTGSGGGGFVLSLWKEKPSNLARLNLIDLG